MMYELCSSFQLQSLSLGYVCSPKLEGKALSQQHLNVPCDRWRSCGRQTTSERCV